MADLLRFATAGSVDPPLRLGHWVMFAVISVSTLGALLAAVVRRSQPRQVAGFVIVATLFFALSNAILVIPLGLVPSWLALASTVVAPKPDRKPLCRNTPTVIPGHTRATRPSVAASSPRSAARLRNMGAPDAILLPCRFVTEAHPPTGAERGWMASVGKDVLARGAIRRSDAS